MCVVLWLLLGRLDDFPALESSSRGCCACAGAEILEAVVVTCCVLLYASFKNRGRKDNQREERESNTTQQYPNNNNTPPHTTHVLYFSISGLIGYAEYRDDPSIKAVKDIKDTPRGYFSGPLVEDESRTREEEFSIYIYNVDPI